MNETLGQLFEALSNIDPLIGGGVAIGALSIGYMAYHTQKKRNLKDVVNDVVTDKASLNTNDVNNITMETKDFHTSEPSYDETTEVTTFKDLDDFSLKPILKEHEKDDTASFADENTESVLNTPENAIDFIEESNKNIDFSLDKSSDNQFSLVNLSTEKLEVTPPTLEIEEISPEKSVYVEEKKINNNVPDIALPEVNHTETSDSSLLLNFALESDKALNKKDAITYLHQAIQAEKIMTEKIRLKIILTSYENTEKSLAAIVNDVPTIEQVEKMSQNKSAPVRFVKPEDLKFVEEDDDLNSDETSENTNIQPSSIGNVDMSDLLAIPQTEVEINNNVNSEPSNIKENINEQVKKHLETMPSLDDVTFQNVDISLEQPNQLEAFFENLADSIEKDNKEVEAQKSQDLEMSKIVIHELLSKDELSKGHAITQSETTLNLSVPTIETKDEIEKKDVAIENLGDVNFNQVSNTEKTEEMVLSNNKVWVHLLFDNNGKQQFVNKKFQLTHDWGSVEGNTSLRRQLNAWMKQTYNQSNYVITMVIPVE